MKTILYTLLFTILGCMTAWTYGLVEDGKIHQESFVVSAAGQSESPTLPEAGQQPEVEDKPEFPTAIHEYIYEVFGEHYDKALLLLSGAKDMNGKYICGGENRGLRQEAVNKNVHKDGSISYDYGIFQINDKFHPVYELHLDTDWKANIDYAKRMFDNDGQTFADRWAAGMCLELYGYEI